MLKLPVPIETILGDVARYSLFHLRDLEGSDEPAAVLARLFPFSGQVPALDLNSLPERLLELLWRFRLVEPVPTAPERVRGSVSLTEYRGKYFLSDTLFENTPNEFIVHSDLSRCMPPHASSLELYRNLRWPAGARSVLDVNCGTGCQSILFAAGYDRLVGFDPSARAVMFSVANSRLNETPATYVTDRWETFRRETYDHVVFNSPHTDAAFGFINSRMVDLLTESGVGQVWGVCCEVTRDDGDLNGLIKRKCCPSGDLQVTGIADPASPFALSADQVRTRTLPENTLLVSHPSQKEAYFQGLVDRDVLEVVSAILLTQRA